MKYIRIIALILAYLLYIIQYIPVYADTEYDVTAPIIKSLEIAGNEGIDVNENMVVNITLTEDGSGVAMIGFTFVNREDNGYRYVRYVAEEGKYIFTGQHVIEIASDPQLAFFSNGTYDLNSVVVYDAYDNKTVYMVQKDEIKGATKHITIVNNNTIEQKMVVDAVDVVNDKPASVADDIYVDMSFGDNAHPSIVEIKYVSNDGCEFNTQSRSYQSMGNGNYRFKTYVCEAITGNLYRINQIIKPGEYKIASIKLHDVYGNNTVLTEQEIRELAGNKKIIINAYKLLEDMEIVQSFEIDSYRLYTPGAIKLNVHCVKNSGIKAISMNIISENGHRKFLYSILDSNVKEEEFTVSIPVNAFLENGKYDVESISVYAGEKIIKYDGVMLAKLLKNMHVMDITSNFDISYYGSTANINGVVQAIDRMKDGEYAIIDYSSKTVADERIFRAMAGRNINVVFQGPDIQWIFNGKDIVEKQCKNIDLNVVIRKTNGEGYGYTNQNDILVMDFENNGLLPGKANIRVSNDYIKARYEFNDKLILCYYDNTPELISRNVKCSEDGYAQIEITHNSTYILSDKMPRLAAPKDIKIKTVDMKTTIEWGKVHGAVGYRIYRSKEKNGEYKLVSVVTSTRTTLSTKPGVYYYRIRAYGKNVDAIVSASKKEIVKPRRPVLTKSKRMSSIVKGKKQFTILYKINTKDKNVYFEIYAKTSKHRTYKKLKKTRQKQFKIDARKYKAVKVRAYIIENNKKIYGNFSVPK